MERDLLDRYLKSEGVIYVGFSDDTVKRIWSWIDTKPKGTIIELICDYGRRLSYIKAALNFQERDAERISNLIRGMADHYRGH